MARGVSAAGGLMVVATRATMRLEDIAAALDGPWWFQVYVVNERRHQRGVRASRCRARRSRARADRGHAVHRLQASRALRAGEHSSSTSSTSARISGRPRPRRAVDRAHQPGRVDLVRDDRLARRASSGLPVLVKGVLRGDDAAAVHGRGCGGDRRVQPRRAAARPGHRDQRSRFPRSSRPSADAGPSSSTAESAAAPTCWWRSRSARPRRWSAARCSGASAAHGAAGVQRVLEAFRDELAHAMGLAGVAGSRISARDLLVPDRGGVPPPPPLSAQLRQTGRRRGLGTARGRQPLRS